MTRARGRAPRGERVQGAVPRNHGPNVSCLAALTPTGICAPLVIEGAIDGQVFVPWLQQWLLPQLAKGTTIVLDNLSVHHNPAVRAAIEAAGCQVRYLPAYQQLSAPATRVRDVLVSLGTGTLMGVLVLLAAQQQRPTIAGYFLQESVPAAHGRNVVNVILVDFRALDTLGETTVLAVAGVGVWALLRLRPPRRQGPGEER